MSFNQVEPLVCFVGIGFPRSLDAGAEPSVPPGIGGSSCLPVHPSLTAGACQRYSDIESSERKRPIV